MRALVVATAVVGCASALCLVALSPEDGAAAVVRRSTGDPTPALAAPEPDREPVLRLRLQVVDSPATDDAATSVSGGAVAFDAAGEHDRPVPAAAASAGHQGASPPPRPRAAAVRPLTPGQRLAQAERELEIARETRRLERQLDAARQALGLDPDAPEARALADVIGLPRDHYANDRHPLLD